MPSLSQTLLQCTTVHLFLLSCSKEPFNPDLDTGPIIACHNQRKLDAERLAMIILGTWKWVYRDCGFSGQDDSVDLGRVLTIQADGTLEIVKGGEILYRGHWTVEMNDRGESQLQTEPLTQHVSGIFATCNNQLYFSGLLDGCQMVYEKK